MTHYNGLRLLADSVIALGLPAVAVAGAQTAEDMMMSQLGTTDVGPVFKEAFEHAAMPVTPELRAKAIQCWTDNQCDTGTGGELT